MNTEYWLHLDYAKRLYMHKIQQEVSISTTLDPVSQTRDLPPPPSPRLWISKDATAPNSEINPQSDRCKTISRYTARHGTDYIIEQCHAVYIRLHEHVIQSRVNMYSAAMQTHLMNCIMKRARVDRTESDLNTISSFLTSSCNPTPCLTHWMHYNNDDSVVLVTDFAYSYSSYYLTHGYSIYR